MTLALIVAVADNGIIGRAGDLPWRLPRDLKWFKEKTMGHALIMGRRTFDSLGALLPGRRAIILTRDRDFTANDVAVVHTLDEALAAAAGDDEPFIAGGAEIYRLALPRVRRAYVTRIHASPVGDTHLDLDLSDFHCVHRQSFDADERNPYPMTFEIHQRTA